MIYEKYYFHKKYLPIFLQPKEMAPFAKSCLLKNKVDFLRMFADVGFEIHEFATTKTVEELYSVEAQRNVRFKTVSWFYQFRALMK